MATEDLSRKKSVYDIVGSSFLISDIQLSYLQNRKRRRSRSHLPHTRQVPCLALTSPPHERDARFANPTTCPLPDTRELVSRVTVAPFALAKSRRRAHRCDSCPSKTPVSAPLLSIFPWRNRATCSLATSRSKPIVPPPPSKTSSATRQPP